MVENMTNSNKNFEAVSSRILEFTGNFHISSHPHTDLLGDMFPGGHQQNISHKIHYLYFGELEIYEHNQDMQWLSVTNSYLY